MFHSAQETFIFITVVGTDKGSIFKYEETDKGTLCSHEKEEITSESECKKAGEFLLSSYRGPTNSRNEYPRCWKRGYYFYFNQNPYAKRTNINSGDSAICRVDVGKNSHL